MAVLSDADRGAVNKEFQEDRSRIWEALGTTLTKADIRAAINAIDTFMNDNAAAMNSAIPQPARAQLTTTQKARLLQFVINKRYLSGV